MGTDTSGVIEIKGSKGNLALLVLGGIVMTAGSLWVLKLAQGSGASAGSLKATIVGYVGAPFFGLCTLVAFYRLLTAARIVVTITPTGITDIRVAAHEILWSTVESVGTRVYRGQKVVVLKVPQSVEDGLGLTRIASMTRRANAALGADGLCITAQGLTISFPKLYEMVVARVQHSQP